MRVYDARTSPWTAIGPATATFGAQNGAQGSSASRCATPVNAQKARTNRCGPSVVIAIRR